MLEVLSRAQIREFDRIAIEERQVPGLLLMENAGRGACDAILRHFATARRFLVLCGAGNNAGDGFVVARQLMTRGLEVRVLALREIAQLSGDARINATAYQSLGGLLIEDSDPTASRLSELLAGCDVAVDALFGTGLNRPLTGPVEQVIEAVNASVVPVAALDLPSGLDADTGQLLGCAIRAELTVSFTAPKLGLFARPSKEWVGQLEIVDIGVPRGALEQTGHSAELIETVDAQQWANARRVPAHKGQAGQVLLIAGGPGTVGAARLCALGAHRAGAGLVTVASTSEVIAVLEGTVAETMTLRIEPSDPLGSLQTKLASADAVAIGPGLGLGPVAQIVVSHLLEQWQGPVVLDADALTLHARLGTQRSKLAPGPRILTPHPAEAARLLASDVPRVQADRFGAAARLAELTGATVLLKGRHSLIARPHEPPWINPTGNAVLAVGGTGDVLTGMIAAFCCDLTPAEGVGLAAWCHGRVADVWAAQHGRRGMIASDVAEGLPSLFGELRG